ncbi:MAG: competence/damage-inducible protein A [Bacillota bacterium]|nr:competence/damage-inducible protein A [Bacillota bacterium]
MKAAIICVGTELLFGDTVNTNGAFLGKMLSQLEIHTMRMEVVGDNEERIVEALERNRRNHDLLIFTGGLGPTVDDITKQVICKALGLELQPDSESLMNIYNKIGPTMTNNNFKQIMFPKDAVILKNPRGTAPGMFYKADDTYVVLLPGPPSELIPMCENYLTPILKELVDSTLVSQYLNVYGIGESSLEDKLKDILSDQGKVKIGTYFDGEKVTLRLTSSDVNRRRAYIGEVEAKIRKTLKDFIITVDNNTLEELLVETLKEAKIKTAVAESCTGGLLASKITSVSGASQVFNLGITAYSVAAKNKQLGVDRMTIENHGAVSPQVAHQMARGISLISNSELTCSITGLAGPKGDGTKAKVGTVIIGIWYRGDFEHYEYHFKGDRKRIRNLATSRALVHLTRKAIAIMHRSKMKSS